MTLLDEAPTRSGESRLKRLKSATNAVHDRLDKRIMEHNPFASRESYARFLRMQLALHERVEGAYWNAELNGLIPGLADRARLDDVRQDMDDLGVEVPAPEAAPAMSKAEAMGWLYVTEGSNLGAAFLLKAAAKLDLTEEFGARHLAPHPEGRGLNWRRFSAAFDAIPLTPDQEDEADRAAQAAFQFVHEKVRQEFEA
ncbi:biliverdin-producing heme oxygenase [Terrihabitans sp. B22-R8]|uniref:biliverdin-producing heme oxygenase n=1 Tax=Terrihabitans sp. B22-R8 TaxID=3425128 RepID=UPI00403D4F7A